jgi:hypothetical protein
LLDKLFFHYIDSYDVRAVHVQISAAAAEINRKHKLANLLPLSSSRAHTHQQHQQTRSNHMNNNELELDLSLFLSLSLSSMTGRINNIMQFSLSEKQP